MQIEMKDARLDFEDFEESIRRPIVATTKLERLWRRAVSFLSKFFSGVWHYLLSFRNIALTASACVSCWLCANVFGFSFEINMTLVSTAVIFPICFAISESFKRREKVTEAAASLKASVLTMYWIYRDWLPVQYRVEYAAKTASALAYFLMKCAAFLHNPVQGPDRSRDLREIYTCLSSLSQLNEDLTKKMGYAKSGEGGASRVNQYLRLLANDFEKLRAVRDYRMPIGLLAFCNVLLHVLPMLMGPKYAFEAAKNCTGSAGCLGAGYFLAALFSIVTGGLYKVMAELEDPYDGQGPDDVNLTFATQFLAMARLQPQDLDAPPFNFLTKLKMNHEFTEC